MAAEDVQKSIENGAEGDQQESYVQENAPSPAAATAVTGEADGNADQVMANREGGEEVPEQKSEPGMDTTLNVASSSLEAAAGGRKRKKVDMQIGETSTGSGTQKQGRPAEGGEIVPRCSVCGRVFGSWPAVFGHMRSHPDRAWRGFFPPPTFNPAGSPEEQQQPGGLEIDLNVAMEPTSPPPPPPSPNRDASGDGVLDLNFPPPEE